MKMSFSALVAVVAIYAFGCSMSYSLGKSNAKPKRDKKSGRFLKQ